MVDAIHLTPVDRQWVEPLARHIGCNCPDSVFEQLRRRELSPAGSGTVIEIGARLLVALVPADRAGEGEALLQSGRRMRDADGLNRFRLVLVGEVAPGTLCQLTDAAAAMDERTHVHALPESVLKDLLAR